MKNLQALTNNFLATGHPAAKIGQFLIEHANNLEYLEVNIGAYLEAIKADRKEHVEEGARLFKNSLRKTLYLIEYYRVHHSTREGGWTINFAWVRAVDRTTAVETLKKADEDFDHTITIGEQIEIFPLAGCDNPLVLE